MHAYPNQICFGIGYAMDVITVALKMNYYFMNCYKKIIDNMGDYKDSWTGKEANWIDKCEPPANTAVIKLFEDDLTKTVSETSLIGGKTQDEQGCIRFGGWSSWNPSVYVLKAGNYFL